MKRNDNVQCLECQKGVYDPNTHVTFRSDEVHHCASLRPVMFNGMIYHDVKSRDCDCSNGWRAIVNKKMRYFPKVDGNILICKRCLVGASPAYYDDYDAKMYIIQHLTRKEMDNAKCALYERKYRNDHVRKYDNPETIYLIMHGFQLPNELCRELCNMTFLH